MYKTAFCSSYIKKLALIFHSKNKFFLHTLHFWCLIGRSVQTYRLDGDKGFNFSQIDKAFVCQKKNHFQITSCLSFNDAPQYVMTAEGPKPVEGFFMHFYGVKVCDPFRLLVCISFYSTF